MLAADVRRDELETTRATARERGLDLAIAITDVTSSEQTRALAGRARELMGGLDALVNNAAIVDVSRLPSVVLASVAMNPGARALTRMRSAPSSRASVRVIPMVSDESAFVTGQTLLVNGGRLLH